MIANGNVNYSVDIGTDGLPYLTQLELGGRYWTPVCKLSAEQARDLNDIIRRSDVEGFVRYNTKKLKV